MTTDVHPTYGPLAIANAVIVLEDGRTPLEINKLVHLIHGWSLANGRSIVCGAAEVWRNGPIYRDVYAAMEHLGHKRAKAVLPFAGTKTVPLIPKSDAWAWLVVGSVLKAHRADQSCRLSEICHAPGSPWKTVAERHDFSVPVGTTIPDHDMLAHFGPLVAAARAANAGKNAVPY